MMWGLMQDHDYYQKVISDCLKEQRRYPTMEEAQKSLWDSVNPDKDIKPKVVFDFNIPVEVQFPVGFERPEEYPSQYGDEGENKYYCVFPVMHQGDEAAIVTSAYSLLRGLKALEPLAGKTVKITKKMDKGKQQYVVELMNDPKNTTIQ